ncbi:metal tolerance protein 1-like [Dorcoceras hygrometricum]|uniref:Metal tolerance protein 1-like n=1 Tax=Dorcoceras hygrometricum TaxID=472368 RepID=A0A2Z7BRS1_9LAMI|nr:metal tolerance protein 1-like [Dorcoceras hygrometricum]
MDTRSSEHGHVIEVCTDVRATERGSAGIKACGGAACGFSDAQSSSKDAQERSASMRKLLIAVALCVLFMTVEVVGGIKANSLAILTDAAHLLSDVAAFAISLFSLWAGGWEATPQVQGFLMFWSRFGLLVNVIMAFLLGHDHGHGHGHDHNHGHGSGHGHGHHEHEDHDHGSDGGHVHHHGVSVTYHDPRHSKHDDHYHIHDGGSTEPLLKNSDEDENESKGGNEKKKKKKKQLNINVQGAYLHVLGDSIQSIGVMIGGAIIWYKPEWKIIDLICTLIFSIIVLGTTIRMLRNILEVLMESTPREIDATRLEKGLCDMEEVVAIHELHIWAITVGKVLLACHVKVKPEADADMVLDKVIDYIKREYNISHVTIQIERE